MWVLVIPYLILLLLISGLVCFLRKSLVRGGLFVLLAFALNYVSETYAFKTLFTTTENSGKRIRVMSYNIHNNGMYLDKNPNAIDSLLFFIKKETPDIIFLTEYWRYKRPQLAIMLHRIYPYCSSYVFDKSDKTDFFLCSRYPVSNVRRFKKQGLKQMLVHGMDVEIDGVKVCLIGCHLQSNNIGKKDGTFWDNLRNGYEQRRQQVERIRDSVVSYQCPVIVMGDLNDISGSYVLQTLEKTGLKNAWWDRGLGYGATYTSWGGGWRIDHILVSEDFIVGEVWVPQVPFSDHFPVIADLYIKN